MTELEELLQRLIAERETVPMPRWILTGPPRRADFKDGTSIAVGRPMRSR
jgi:hypothetical protein